MGTQREGLSIMFMLSLMQPSGLYELEQDSLEAISAQLLQMIRMKSYELYTHSINVANYSVSIAAKLGLPANEIEQIRHGALLHDLGLLMMPSTVLKKHPSLIVKKCLNIVNIQRMGQT